MTFSDGREEGLWRRVDATLEWEKQEYLGDPYKSPNCAAQKLRSSQPSCRDFVFLTEKRE